jgi:hypothetical protein
MTDTPQIPDVQLGDDPISKMLLSAVNKAGGTLFNAETLQAIQSAGSKLLTVVSPVATVATNLTQAAMTTVASLGTDSPTRVDQTSTLSKENESQQPQAGVLVTQSNTPEQFTPTAISAAVQPAREQGYSV